jgi:hypothetical protein
MRTIPRIGGKLWPVCLLLALLVLLPMSAIAQEGATDGGGTPAGEAVEEAGSGGVGEPGLPQNQNMQDRLVSYDGTADLFIESLKGLNRGDSVFIGFDYTSASEADLYNLTLAILRYCFDNGLKVTAFTTDKTQLLFFSDMLVPELPEGEEESEDAIAERERRLGLALSYLQSYAADEEIPADGEVATGLTGAQKGWLEHLVNNFSGDGFDIGSLTEQWLTEKLDEPVAVTYIDLALTEMSREYNIAEGVDFVNMGYVEPDEEILSEAQSADLLVDISSVTTPIWWIDSSLDAIGLSLNFDQYNPAAYQGSVVVTESTDFVISTGAGNEFTIGGTTALPESWWEEKELEPQDIVFDFSGISEANQLSVSIGEMELSVDTTGEGTVTYKHDDEPMFGISFDFSELEPSGLFIATVNVPRTINIAEDGWTPDWWISKALDRMRPRLSVGSAYGNYEELIVYYKLGLISGLARGLKGAAEFEALAGHPGKATELLPQIEQFAIPGNSVLSDRRNDEGGALVMEFNSSNPPEEEDEAAEEEEPTIKYDDAVMQWGIDPATGNPVITTQFEYRSYHSMVIGEEQKPWEQVDAFPTDSQYIWEDPASFGFFLSDRNQGSKDHYSMYENYYPTIGIYSYTIEPDPQNPVVPIPDPNDPDKFIPDPNIVPRLNVSAMVFDEQVEDWENLPVFADLRPFDGEKIQLSYVVPDVVETMAPWDHKFVGNSPFIPENVTTTKPYFVLFTAPVRGVGKAVMEIQPDADEHGLVQVKSSGSEPQVPDNRFEHYFRLYAVPAGYILSEGEELPPETWMVGSEMGPMIASANIWNVARTNSALWALLICAGVMGFILRARSGASLFVRRIAGLDHVEEAIGRATEMGRPILYTTGLGYVSDIATIASFNILGQVARKIADYETRLMVPSRDPIVMAVCQEVVQEAYIDAGRPDAYNKDDIFFLTDDQFAYTAAVDGIMVREKPATNFFMGMFYAESLLLAETGASTGAIQIAGTDALAQLPFFITACDYTLIGEELYAASAYLSREPLLLGSLKGQDFAKMILMIATFIGTLLIFFNIEFIKQLFQAF